MGIHRAVKGGATLRVYSIPEEGLECEVPSIVQFLTLEKWGDGATRQTGTLLLLYEGGLWKVWINDRDAGRAAWLSAASLDALWQTLEVRLDSDELEWRAATGSKRRN